MGTEEIHGTRIRRHTPDDFIIGEDGRILKIIEDVKTKNHADQVLAEMGN